MSPSHPTGTDRDTSLTATVKRTGIEFIEDEMTDKAAGLTYYALLSLFPALIALVSIVGLFADPQATTQKLTEIVGNLGPDTAVDTFKGPVESITSNRGSSAAALVISLALALFSASSYVGAFSRASNVIYETREGRPFWKLRPFQILVTLGMILILAVLALGLVMSGPIVNAVADPLGIGSTAITVWGIAKWPVMAVLAVLLIAVLYHTSPNVKPHGFRWFTPGAAVALVVWIIASAGFAFYVSNFGSYNKTYGALSGFIILLIWFWISNLALLFGLQLNSEIQRNREFEQGLARSERELQAEPRETPQPKRTV
jgi:membrane protein